MILERFEKRITDVLVANIVGMKMIRKKAFTLIELLVVIAIIAVLMAILMPSLQRVRMQAKNVVCKSNLKTYGLVMRLYNDDWDDGFPESYTAIFSIETIDEGVRLAGGWNPSVPEEHNLIPDGAYIPYLKGNVKSNICPIFRRVYQAKWPERGKVGFTYSFNWPLKGITDTVRSFRPGLVISIHKLASQS